MFTPRMRRRRHSLDTYIRGEVEELKLAIESSPVPLRPQLREATSGEAEEDSVATSSRSERLSA